MKRTLFLYVILHTATIIAPPEDDLFSLNLRSRKDSKSTQEQDIQERRTQKKLAPTTIRQENIKSQETEVKLPHEYQKNGRSLFEDELKTAFEARKKNSKLTRKTSLKKAQDLWEQSQRSHVPAREFVMHLKNRYEHSLHDIYSGEKNSFARKEFEADLEEISPYLYKTWRDSFFVARNKGQGIVRTDEPFFTWLNENPSYLTYPEKENEATPLEIACDGKSTEMAQKILDIANTHEIKIKTLIEPLIEKYKIIYLEKGENAAYDYLQSIYDLHIHELSHAMFDALSIIPFPQKS